jgi:K+-sensing histidine kinase KdpD
MQLNRVGRTYIDVPALRPGTVGAYALAFVSVVIATALRVAIDPYVAGVPFVAYLPAVVITAQISGFGAGLFCVVLSAAAAAFFVLPPRLSFYVERPEDFADLMLFIPEALFYLILIAGMRSTIERYRELSQRPEQQSVALRESRERLGSVVAELQHRTRNLISVGGTMAKGTLRTSKTFDDFIAIFRIV